MDLMKMPRSSPVSLDLLPFRLTPRPAEPVSLRGISYISCSLPSSNTRLPASSPFWKREKEQRRDEGRPNLNEHLLPKFKLLFQTGKACSYTHLIPTLHNNCCVWSLTIEVGAPYLMHWLIMRAPTPHWLYSTPKTRRKKKKKRREREGEEKRIKESDGRRLRGRKKTGSKRKEKRGERSRCCVLEREMKV